MGKLWSFEAMDTLFFRDSRPMNAGESCWIESLFPPTAQTLQGAIRTAILDYLNADIKNFLQGEPCLENGSSLKDEIGDATSIGALKLTGPFLLKDGEICFPVPLDLVQNRQGQFGLLSPSASPIHSDLGCIRFPAISGRGYKTLESKYISLKGLQNLLDAKLNHIKPISLIADSPDQEAFGDFEPKMGLARNNQLRQNIEGMLFAIAPVRPKPHVKICVEVDGITEDKYPKSYFLQKLGGEGKLAKVLVQEAISLPKHCINEKHDHIYFKIVFITPALIGSNILLPDSKYIPSEKNCLNSNDIQPLWSGEFQGCTLEVISACVGKPMKISGWNMAERKPKPLRSFIPAGSVFFCRAHHEQLENIKNLHNAKAGEDTEYGFGHMVIGKWEEIREND